MSTFAVPAHVVTLPRRNPLTGLAVKLFADGADKNGILQMYKNEAIEGFTTNPTLMRKAGITDYEKFARDIISAIPDRPISLEVFADDFSEMERQARIIASWGDNVYAKIPIVNTENRSAEYLVRRLTQDGIKLNVTALMTLSQVELMAECVERGAPCYISVFAGRIADTGRDPVPMMRDAVDILSDVPNAELIWASPRELLNVFQADEIGCHIITATNDILNKWKFVGKNLADFSLETVQMFYNDATASGFSL